MIGAAPRGQPRMPAMRRPHGCAGLRVRRRTVLWTLRRPCMGRPVPRQLLRNALLDLTTIVPATAYHRRSYARDTVGIAPLNLIRRVAERTDIREVRMIVTYCTGMVRRKLDGLPHMTRSAGRP